MRSGIHVFLTALSCDVWQLSHTLSPGRGQRAEKDHAFLKRPPSAAEGWPVVKAVGCGGCWVAGVKG